MFPWPTGVVGEAAAITRVGIGAPAATGASAAETASTTVVAAAINRDPSRVQKRASPP